MLLLFRVSFVNHTSPTTGIIPPDFDWLIILQKSEDSFFGICLSCYENLNLTAYYTIVTWILLKFGIELLEKTSESFF